MIKTSISFVASLVVIGVSNATTSTAPPTGRGCSGHLSPLAPTMDAAWLALSGADKVDYLDSASELVTGFFERAPVKSWTNNDIAHFVGQTATYGSGSPDEVLKQVQPEHHALVSHILTLARQTRTFHGHDGKFLVRKNDRLPRSSDPSETEITVSIYLDEAGGLMGARVFWMVPGFFLSGFLDQDTHVIFRQPPHHWYWLQHMFM